jgi:peptide/nickel transport system permease protein
VSNDIVPTAGDTHEQEVTVVPRRGRTGGTILGPLFDMFRMVGRDKFAVVAACIVAMFVIVAFIAPYIAPHGLFEAARGADGKIMRLAPPSWSHLLGTNYYGHDVLTQLILGTRVALIVGFAAATMVFFISTLLGIMAGYFGHYVDDVIMRLADFALSVPTLPVAIVIVAVTGPSLTTIILIIGGLFWRNGTRIVRSVAITEKEKAYVKAARAAGASHFHTMVYHILPNVLPVAFLWMTVSVAFAILNEASLSFIGLGDPRVASWGQMLNLAFSSGAIRSAPWWVVPPCMCLVLLVTSVYLIGRAFEEQTNPRLRGR